MLPRRIQLILATVLCGAAAQHSFPPALHLKNAQPSDSLRVHGNTRLTDTTGINSAAENLSSSKLLPSTIKELAPLERAVPQGYDLVFGPISAANEAPGYMGFVFLDKYDPRACAVKCNQRTPDAEGGACKYFNIWRAEVNGTAKTYTCSMYTLPTNASTATNTGQGNITVSLSRGYARKTYLTDGDFEQYTCPEGQDPAFCFGEQAPGWNGTSPVGGFKDATIFHFEEYAHEGSGVGLLGCAFGTDAMPGTLTPTLSGLQRGRNYSVQFFHSSTYSGEDLEGPSFVEVWWNGVLAGSVRVGYSPWTYFAFNVKALGNGKDVLAFKGGMAPAYDFIDDVYVFLA